MPIYEYQCDSCSAITEDLQKFSDPPLDECPECGGKHTICDGKPRPEWRTYAFACGCGYVTEIQVYHDKGGLAGRN